LNGWLHLIKCLLKQFSDYYSTVSIFNIFLVKSANVRNVPMQEIQFPLFLLSYTVYCFFNVFISQKNWAQTSGRQNQGLTPGTPHITLQMRGVNTGLNPGFGILRCGPWNRRASENNINTFSVQIMQFYIDYYFSKLYIFYLIYIISNTQSCCLCHTGVSVGPFCSTEVHHMLLQIALKRLPLRSCPLLVVHKI
jgi:hypothetical protein